MKLPFLAWRTNRACVLCLFAVVAVALGGGCLAPAAPEGAARPTLLEPRWERGAFEEHIDFFRDAFEEGPPAAADDVEPLGRYVSAAMREAWLQPVVEGRYRLWQAPGQPLAYAGYVGGKHPPVAEEAVLVCAFLGGRETAPEAAALLEVARLYGVAAQYTLMPERSILFALWSRAVDPSVAASSGAADSVAGEADPLAGLRAYLRQPTWRLDKVRAVIFMSLPAHLRPEARALLAEHDIALLRATSAPSDAGGEGPSAGSSAAATATEPERVAARRARLLAERTHRRLLAATLTSGPFLPSLGDTLRVPRSGDHAQQRDAQHETRSTRRAARDAQQR